MGHERLRITPSPGHTPEMIDHLVDSLEEIWSRHGFKRVADYEAESGRCGVGVKGLPQVKPIWSKEQLNYQLSIDEGERSAL